MDVAYCNHERRSDWLTHLTQLRDVSTTADGEEGEPLIDGTSLNDMLHWMHSRTVHVSQLHVDPAAFASGEVTFSQPLPSVEGLYFNVNTHLVGELDVCEPVLRLLSCFPHLKTMSLWVDLKDHEFTALMRKVGGQLEGLDVSHCFELSPNTVAPLVCSFGNRLHVLRLGPVDDDGLVAIARCCHCLTDLDLSCDDFRSFDGFQQLCSANAGTLTKLSVLQFSCREVLPHAAAVLLHITAVCTKITNFRVDTSIESTLIVHSLLIHCPAPL